MMASLVLLLKRLGLLLLIYSLSRALFFTFNFQSYGSVSPLEVLTAFVVGVRFDLAVICRINSVFIVLSMLPFLFVEKAWYQKLIKIVFLISNIPFLIVNVADYEYFKFTGQRSSLSLLDLGSDIADQIAPLSLHYWYLIAVGGLLIIVFYSLIPELGNRTAARPLRQQAWSRAWGYLILILVVALAIIGGRGGWQRRRLTVALAQVGDVDDLTHLALNSTYTLINSQRKCDTGSNSEVHYFSSAEELRKQFPPQTSPGRARHLRLDNVVIIIVESLSAEYTGIGNPHHGYTPFLDQLAYKGVFFKNSFADGRRSIDAPPSILAGLPHLRDETFFCTRFKHLHGIGTALKERGYDTSFFHGGKNGTMNFDTFSQRMGFDRYYGLNEYPRPQDSDGVWGIYDEPMMQFVAHELSHKRQPFASVVFTLSTHNPYKIPPQYAGVFPEGDLPIHRTVAYFDYALKKFFETAEKMAWYKHTLFVITGDHIGPLTHGHSRMIDSYRVPLVFFHPGRKLPAIDPNRITQHADIEPSVLDFLGISIDKTLPFGRSVFDSTNDGLALGQKNENYWLAYQNYYLEYRLNGPSRLYGLARLDVPIADKPDVKARLERMLKAYIQWFNNGLAEDNLYR